MTRQFGSRGKTRMAHLAELDIARAALRFVQAGLHKAGGNSSSMAMDFLCAAVERHLSECTLQGYAMGAPVPGITIPEMHEAQKEALIAFLQGFKMQVERYRLTPVAPYLGVMSNEIEDDLAVYVGCQGAARTAPEGEPLEKAYAMCKLNVQRIEQRLGLLYTLGAMLQYGPHVDSSMSAHVEQLAAFLFQMRQTQLVRTFAMGSLMGGAALEENRELAKKMFGSGMSVMSLTRMDAILPSYYTTSEEEALQKAIAQA